MKKAMLLVSGLILSTLVFSQDNYYWQNPRPQGANLHGVYFLNPLTGWMAGDAGVILHTADGGNTWETQNSGVNGILRDVFFTDENTGWVVGNSCTILHTSDGGQSWILQNTLTFPDLFSVSFINSDTGWIFGSYQTVLRTTNGGQHWEELTQGPPTGYNYNEGVFLNYSEGWAAGGSFIGNTYGKICHSTDGGATWQEVYTTTAALNSISFPDPDTGYACGDNGILLKTSDGGLSWNTVTTGIYNYGLQHVSFSSPARGFVLLQPSGLYNIIRTLDGGLTWTTNYVGPELCENEKIFCTGDSNAYIAGYNGMMFKTTNFGNDWQELCQGTHDNLYDICFTDDSHGWATGTGYPSSVIHTTNGGQKWEEVAIPFFNTQNFRAISFYNNEEGIVVGDNGPILKTSDGGNHWDSVSRPPSSLLWKAGYFDNMHPVIAGWGGKILHSSDGGNTWNVFQSIKNTAFTGLCIPDPLHAYAVGYYDPQVVYTDDAGVTWNEVPTGTTDGFRSVHFINQQEGWVGCMNGIVLHTADAGLTWDSHTIAGGGILLAIHFFDSMNGEAMNMVSRFFTSDGGVTWSSEDIPYNRTFQAAWYKDQHIAWFAGDGGTILLSSDYITGVSENKKSADRFLIFPNPASDHINLITDLTSFGSSAVFIISDLSGRVIRSIDIPASGALNNIGIGNLSKGIYLGTLSLASGKRLNSKFVVLGQ